MSIDDGARRARPALMVAGTSSGCGKTTVAKGILSLFKSRGFDVQPFKLGPDFIDAGHLAMIAGRATVNLDQHLLTPPGQDGNAFEYLREEFLAAGRSDQALVIEAVGGLFDDWFHDGTSPAAIAKRLTVPLVLVLDGLKSCQTLGIMANALLSHDPELDLAGVLVNRVTSEEHYRRIVEALDAEHQPKLLGYVLNNERLNVKERHLGLVTSPELAAGDGVFPLAEFEAHVDVEKLLGLEVSLPGEASPRRPGKTVCRLAIARDEAFSFYYRYNLELLEDLGCELVFFSPLSDAALPGEIDGLYLGGGFPELYLEPLAANSALRREIAYQANEGMPIYAECGGLIYLSQEIQTCDASATFPGVGVLPLTVRFTQKLTLDYVECEIVRDCLLGRPGDLLRGHIFHVSKIDRENELPCAYAMHMLTASRTQPEGFSYQNVLASYAHLHFRSCPRAAESFVEAVKAFRSSELEAVAR